MIRARRLESQACLDYRNCHRRKWPPTPPGPGPNTQSGPRCRPSDVPQRPIVSVRGATRYLHRYFRPLQRLTDPGHIEARRIHSDCAVCLFLTGAASYRRIGDLLVLIVRITESGGRLLPQPFNGVPGQIECESCLRRQPPCEPSRCQGQHGAVSGYVGPLARCGLALQRPPRVVTPPKAVKRITSDEFLLHGDRKVPGSPGHDAGR